MDITAVRKALWDAYEEARKDPEFCGKTSEAHVSVNYPEFFSVATEEEFLRPYEIEIYSYALGPSRLHTFRFAKRDRQVDCRTWESPDPCAKAVEVIAQWMAEFRQRGDE